MKVTEEALYTEDHVIDVWCAGRPSRDGSGLTSHAGKIAKVARLSHVPHPDLPVEAAWAIEPISYGPKVPTVVQYVVGGQVVDPATREGRRAIAGAREAGSYVNVKWVLSCKLCRLHVIESQRKLGPVLDKMRAAGVSDVSLPGLAAIV